MRSFFKHMYSLPQTLSPKTALFWVLEFSIFKSHWRVGKGKDVKQMVKKFQSSGVKMFAHVICYLVKDTVWFRTQVQFIAISPLISLASRNLSSFIAQSWLYILIFQEGRSALGFQKHPYGSSSKHHSSESFQGIRFQSQLLSDASVNLHTFSTK